MVSNFLMRRGGFLVLAASILVLLLATAGLADNTTMELFENGSTRETTKDDEGNIIKTVDTSKPSAEGVQTVTISTYGPEGDETSFEKKKTEKGKLISSEGYENEEEGSSYWIYVYNGQGKIIYESHEWWENGELVEGSRTSYGYLQREDKIPDKIETQYYLPTSGTWGRIPEAWVIPKPVQPKTAREKPVQPKTAEEKPRPVQPKTAEEKPTTEDVVPVVGDLVPEPTKPKKAEEKPEPGGNWIREPSGEYHYQPGAEEKTTGMRPTPDTSFYVGIYGGLGGIGPNPSLNMSSNDPHALVGTADPATSFRVPGGLGLAATGGAGLGTWFNYPGVQLPSWLKYFGFSLSYMHYALQYGAQGGSYGQNTTFPGPVMVNSTGACTFSSTGAVNSLGFMFKGRYGWLQDEQVPFGRLQAWLGLGPSLNFVTQTPTVRFNTITSVNGTPNFTSLNAYQKFNSASTTVVGLQVGVGGSYYIFRWLSADAFLQYDHFAPSFSLTGPGGITGNVTIPVDQISLNGGLSVHF